MRRVYVGRLSHHVRERDVQRFFRSEGKIREVLMKDGFAFVEFDHSEDAEAAVRHLNGRDINGDRVHVEFAKGPPRGRESGRDAGRDIGREPSRDFSRDGGRDSGRLGMGPMGRAPIRNGPMQNRNNFRNSRGSRDHSDSHGGSGRASGISYAEKYGPPRNTDYRVIVENLSSRVSWQDLKDLMRNAGEVTFADAHKRERNMGIVDFASLKDMKQAVETLNDTEFHGRRIKVYEDKSRRTRSNNNRSLGGDQCSPVSRSRSRSRSAHSRSKSKSASRSRSKSDSRSKSKSRSRSRSRSKSIKSASRSRSKSVSRSRSRSKSTSPNPKKTRLSASPTNLSAELGDNS